MTAIRQLQMSYDPEQDRLLLRVNTSTDDEFRFWLTRRFAMLLQKALQAHRDADPDVATQPSPDAQRAVQSFKQEAAQESGNFKEAFKGSESFPLGEDPILAFKLSYRVRGGKLHLSIEPKAGPGINLVLDGELNFNVTRLLRTASIKAAWELNWENSGIVEVPEKRVIN